MKKNVYVFIILLTIFFARVNGQSRPAIPEVESYGKVSMADMEMTSCDFEKNANAEILFDVGKMTDAVMERHVRIKIFNQFGMGWANFRIEYPYFETKFGVAEVQGETFNLVDGKVEVTPLDKKQIYIEKTNRYISTVVFALPNVRPGSVIEFTSKMNFNGNWYFQNNIPTRYSEIKTDFSPSAYTSFKFVPYVTMPYAKDVGANNDYNQTKAMAYVPSLPKEPFVNSSIAALQRVEFMGIINNYGTWQSIGELLSKGYDHNQYIDVRLPDEDDILAHARALKSDDEKIACIFDYVKNNLNWNKIDDFYPEESTSYAWTKKTATLAQINWILVHLLKKTGIKCYPVITADKATGKMNPALPNILQMRNMVALIPVDSATNYVLDASDKLNMYNVIPANYLNIFGLLIDRDNESYNMVFLNSEKPVVQSAYFNVEIKPDGKMTGAAEITSDSYNRYAAEKNYKLLGEKLYLDSLLGKDNSIKITSFKMENMDIDSLPLTQKIEFSQYLAGADEHYIYFNTNPFSIMGENPFKGDKRFADIDFGYRQDFSISGIYKIPNGYKAETLPKNVTSFMPDKSIMFKRMVAQDNGTIVVRYTLDHKKSIYFAKDYDDIKAFYKNMYDMLNEQIVLKKS
jgi:hypothetical protein